MKREFCIMHIAKSNYAWVIKTNKQFVLESWIFQWKKDNQTMKMSSEGGRYVWHFHHKTTKFTKLLPACCCAYIQLNSNKIRSPLWSWHLDGLPQKYLAYWKHNNLHSGNNVLGCKRCRGATWIGMFIANTSINDWGWKMHTRICC